MKKSWRQNRIYIPDFNNKNYPVIPSTKFFDQLSFIGNEFVGCFLLETHKGLVLFDCMNQDEISISTIEKGILDLGKDIQKLHAIIISHGHEDHFGRADYFQKKYNTNIYISQIDYNLAKKDINFHANHFLNDGETLDFGDVQIKAIFTPGHTPGCFSFLIPITDEGNLHTAALWGGAGIMQDSNVKDYLTSWKKFSNICNQNKVDVEIATHPFLDMGKDRLKIVRNITDGVPNPFVIGKNGYRYYEKMFYDYAINTTSNKESTKI